MSFAIEVRQAKSETGLVPDNPEGLFSKLSPALGLATSAKSVKMDVAKALVENNLVQGKSPEEVVAMVAGRLNITLPQGLLLPVNLFEETQDIKGVPFAVPGSRVKEEFREVFGVYEQYNKPKAVKENSKPKVKKQPKEEQPAVSSQVNLAKYFEHYVK